MSIQNLNLKKGMRDIYLLLGMFMKLVIIIFIQILFILRKDKEKNEGIITFNITHDIY